MLVDTLVLNNKRCMGCGVCENSCPKQAVTLKPDKDGFYMANINEDKCILCGKCENVCPQLNYTSENRKEPICFAVKAKHEELMKSSSGGAFSILAKLIIDNGGLVTGAVYDEDFRGVSLKIVSSETGMRKMQGSKYVYAKPGNIYKEVRDKLEEGYPILFTGLPCHVAALNKFLGKNYDNLITVDLICSGVPSEKVFDAYLDDITKEREIVSINMRPKKYGWDEDGIEIKFLDGTEHMIHGIRDPYLKGYLRGLFRADACYDCKYAIMPRVADFTIGDFWHADKLFDDEDFSDGIGCILLNNEKADRYFNNVKNQFDSVREIPVSFLRRFNMFGIKRTAHLGRPRFFEMINKGVQFRKAVKDCLEWKFDVALSGCFTVPNYGGELTYYALYNTLKDMGKTVIMVERRANIKGYDIPRPNAFRNNPYPYYDICRIHKSFEEQKELNARVKNFVLGSDQIWNYKILGSREEVKSWSFDYAAPYRNRIAYAASFGSNKFMGTDEEKTEFSQLLKNFNKISVREQSGVSLCKEISNMDAECVVDPVLLCDKAHFDVLAENSFSRDTDFLFAYIIHPESGSKFEGIEKIADKMKLGLRVTISADMRLENMAAKNQFPFSYENNCSVEDWVYYIKNCSFVVTTSFHALCFCMKYQKPFVFLQGMMTDEHGFDRIRTILEMAGLMDRVFPNINAVINSDIVDKRIDWGLVQERLQPEIDKSRKWLEKALI